MTVKAVLAIRQRLGDMAKMPENLTVIFVVGCLLFFALTLSSHSSCDPGTALPWLSCSRWG